MFVSAVVNPSASNDVRFVAVGLRHFHHSSIECVEWRISKFSYRLSSTLEVEAVIDITTDTF